MSGLVLGLMGSKSLLAWGGSQAYMEMRREDQGTYHNLLLHLIVVFNRLRDWTALHRTGVLDYIANQEVVRRHTLIPPRGYSIAGVSGSCGPWVDGFSLIITR